jgi:hypothetical protein
MVLQTPAPGGAGNDCMNVDQVVENIIGLTTAIKDLNETIQERAQPYADRLQTLQEEMNRDLSELKAQSEKMKLELAEDKNILIENWPVDSGRIEQSGWKLDRKERKSAEVVDELSLMGTLLKVLPQNKMPCNIAWNKTKLAKLIENGVIPVEQARSTVTLSIAITPPASAADEEAANEERADRDMADKVDRAAIGHFSTLSGAGSP